MVLFLFVVMMLDVNFDSLREHFRSYMPVGADRRCARADRDGARRSSTAAIGSHGRGRLRRRRGSNTSALGRLLYVDYVYPFEIAAVMLLVAIIAAIALTHRKRRERKHQDPGEQVKVRREDRVRLVDCRRRRRN